MLDQVPKPILAIVIVLALLLVSYALAQAGVGPFRSLLTATLPQDILRTFSVGAGG